MTDLNPWFVMLGQNIAWLLALSLLYQLVPSYMRAQHPGYRMPVLPAPNERGLPRAMRGMTLDMTSDQRLASALKESEERYERLADAAFEGLGFSENGIIVDANARLAEMLGYTREELIGMPVEQLVAPESRELVRRRMLTGYQAAYAHLALRKDGTIVPVEVRSRRAQYHGRPIRVTAIHDISDRLAAEQALAASEARFRAIFERAAVGIVLLDLAGHPIESNPALQTMLGYSADELRQMPCTAFTDADDMASDLQLFGELIAGTRESFQFEKCYVHKDGRTVCGNLRVSLMRDVEGAPRFAIAMVEDITERRQIESRYLQSQKMESLGRLAGGIAHDFNNILTIILGNSDLLLADLDPSHALYRDIAQIQQGAERAAALTRQLLAFSRQQVLQPIVLNPNTVVASVEQLLRRLIGEDITLVTRLEERLGAVQADPGQLEQVLWNLVVNARDAMPTGGTLIIETANVVLDASYANDRGNVANCRYSMLAVSDTGIGMDADTQARIFEPFFTTKGAGKGTGLGMATVYGIVKQSGGHIWVYSEVGRGTTFKIYLPHVTETPATPVPAWALAQVPRGTGTILLVEDEAQVRELAGRVLRAQGYQVLEAADGSTALEIAADHQGSIDLLLTDMIMPGGVSGSQLAEQLRARQPATKVLFMSGYTDQVLVHHRLVAPHQDVLQKPFTPALWPV